MAAPQVPGSVGLSLLGEDHVLLLRPGQLQTVTTPPLVTLAARGEGEVLHILVSSLGYGQQLGEVVLLPGERMEVVRRLRETYLQTVSAP